MEGQFGEIHVVVAAEEVVFVLDGLHPRQAELHRQLQVLHGAPGALVGEAEMEDLALAHQFAHHLQHL